MAQRLRRVWMTLALLGAGSLLLLAACSPTANQPATDTAVETAAAEPEGDTHGTEDDHAEAAELEGEAAHEGEHEGEASHEGENEHEHGGEAEMLALPELSALPLDGRPLRVVATTSIIGDVVSRVGGEAIELTTLMGPAQDPHSYQPAAADLTAVANADVIFVNGWNLEEGLLDDLSNIAENALLVPVSAGIEPLAFGEGAHADEHEDEAHEEEGEHHHSGADPHTWLSVHNVMKWVENAEASLSALDPSNATQYSANAAAFMAELESLDDYARTQLATIPEERRVLVTNHEAFAYFADEYGFEVLGTVIPGASTLAEPTASDLAALIQAMQTEGVCAIFTETTVSDRLAQTVADELNECEDVRIGKLFTGALGATGSGADSYVGMFRANVDTIVSALTSG